MNLNIKKLAPAVFALIMAGSALAAEDNANLTVTANVLNVCAIGPGTLPFGNVSLSVNFGEGTAGTTPADANTTEGVAFSVICTLGTAATIYADWGKNATATPRKMLSGTDALEYTLYTSSEYTTELTPSTGISYTGTGLPQTNVVIYGRITPAQLAAAKKGTYTDTVKLTVSYTP